jgi:uncharacterized protein YegP (UPF0339 family)
MSHLVSRLAIALLLSSGACLVGCGGEDVAAGDEQNATAVAKGKIEIYVGEDSQLYFRVVASNGEKLLRSEAYETRAGAEKGVESVKKNGVEPKRYQLAQSEDGLWFFNLRATNGEIIGTSETYSSKSNAQRGMTTLQKVLKTLSKPSARAVCSLKRLSVAPQGEGVAEVDLDHLDEDGFGFGDSLDAFEGSYSFDIGVQEGFVSVTFYENEHVQDEVGQIGCDLPALERGVTFCDEPIEIDASLGTDDEEKTVHAFDFGCRVD